MNRRNFIQSFSILAAATTYGRTWKVVAGIAVPADPAIAIWEPELAAPCEIHFLWEEGENNLRFSICPIGGLPGPYSIAPHDKYFNRIRGLLSLRQGQTQKITAEVFDENGHRLPHYVKDYDYDYDHPTKLP